MVIEIEGCGEGELEAPLPPQLVIKKATANAKRTLHRKRDKTYPPNCVGVVGYRFE
jgi:hypothetical protein